MALKEREREREREGGGPQGYVHSLTDDNGNNTVSTFDAKQLLVTVVALKESRQPWDVTKNNTKDSVALAYCY